VHVLDQVTEGPKPELVARLGGTYHAHDASAAGQVDIVVEATGAPAVVAQALRGTTRNGIVCLTGVSSGGRPLDFDIGGFNRDVVLENDVVFGTVNANRRHYEAAAVALEQADRDWLRSVISRRVPLDRWQEAFERRPADVKVVVELS
jgi:threonine dehydrogenase-like Zn-dependent dehydrogenase